MKKLICLIILMLACTTCFLFGCGEHEEHEYGEWKTVNGKHERVCVIDGCEEKQVAEHEYGEWKAVEDKHERICTFEGCEEKESEAHEYSEWENIGSKHERSCTTEGCGAKESESHEYGNWSNGGEKHERECTVEGCGAKDSGLHQYGEWENEGETHARRCSAVGCGAMQRISHEYGEWISAGDYHERSCIATGCGATEREEHENDGWFDCGELHQGECIYCGVIIEEEHTYGNSQIEINGILYYECLAEGCGALLEEHNHEFSDWQDKGDYHERSCKIQGCHEFERDQHVYTADYGCFVKDGEKVKYVKSCSYCKSVDEQAVISSNVIEVTTSNAESVFNDIQSNQIIYFTEGTYDELCIANSVQNVIFGGDENSLIKKISVKGECKNLKFTYLNFNGSAPEDGIELENVVDGLFVYKCSFIDASQIYSGNYIELHIYDVKDLVVENCYFNVYKTNTTPINISKLENITIKNCNFEYSAYNIIQVGHKYFKGKIDITNNVINSAYSRMLYFVTSQEITSCNISGNYFGSNENCNKNTGAYVKNGGTAVITLGVNYWASMPVLDPYYFDGAVEFDEEIQLTWDR